MVMMEHVPRSRAALADTRAQLYRLLANSYLPPGDSLAEDLRSGKAARVVAAVQEAYPSLTYMESFGGAPCTGSFSAAPDMQALRLEYTRLFADPQYLLVPCYESMYLDPSGGIMAEPARQVSRAYAAEGLGMAASFRDLPDHISVELEFMAYLCAREGVAWGTSDTSAVRAWMRKEAEFLRDHLLQWLPAFRDQLLKNARSPFYHDVSQLTYLFCFGDYQMTQTMAARR